jgi:hypothetical protein
MASIARRASRCAANTDYTEGAGLFGNPNATRRVLIPERHAGNEDWGQGSSYQVETASKD